MKLPEFETLEEARQYLKDNWLTGVPCPCCKQFVKLYPIKMPSQAVSDLIRLYNLSDGMYGVSHHVTKFSNQTSRAFAKLAHWGLIEADINQNTKKRTSGMWSLTAKGREFVAGERLIQEKAYIFNMKCYGYSQKMISIRIALGNKFNYEELMNEKILTA